MMHEEGSARRGRSSVLQVTHDGLGESVGQGYEPLPLLFGLSQAHRHRPPVQIVQSQTNDLLASQGQLGQAQDDGVVTPSFGSGPGKTVQELSPLLWFQRVWRRRWKWWHRLWHRAGESRAQTPRELQKAKKAAQMNHQSTDTSWT